MLYLTNILHQQTGEVETYRSKWYTGTCKFTFYDEDTKKSFSRRMDMYRAQKFFKERGVVTAEDYYVTIPKRVFNLISYIDYDGTWNERDLDRSIVSQFPTDKLMIDFLADEYGLFVGICNGFVVQRKYMSIMEAIFKVSCVRYENKLYFKGNQGVVYEYVIEDVPKFDVLYTKLNTLGVGR